MGNHKLEFIVSRHSEDKIEIARLTHRVASLERELSQKQDQTSEDVFTSMTRAGNQAYEASGHIFRSMVDAGVEAMNETAHAFAALSDDQDHHNVDQVPAGMVGLFRRMLLIQKAAVDRFEESFNRNHHH